MNNTIAAPATAINAVGAIGIIRLSGNAALQIAGGIFSAKNFNLKKVEPRYMYLGEVKTASFKDKVFLVYFKAPLSYTGEDMVELHCHGGEAVLKGILKEVYLRGARPAHAGEFTKRAFLNKKLTLSEAEGIEDMINAQSLAEAREAGRLLFGELPNGITASEELLLKASSNFEACLDYPDELEEDLRAETKELILTAQQNLKNVLNNSRFKSFVTNGVNVVIAGLTNVGKSSLLNALLNEERAIVTAVAGTTRDTLKEQIEIDGFKLNILDTAGIRETVDEVEEIGVSRAKAAVELSDLVLFVTDLSKPQSDEERAIFETVKHKNHIIVGNKADIKKHNKNAELEIEAKFSKNLNALVNLIKQKLNLKQAAATPTLTRERHLNLVNQALKSINDALLNYNNLTIDLLSTDIKAAHRALCQISGGDAAEDIVDKIFASFCVGK
jgi:tRNA modification GTPase